MRGLIIDSFAGGGGASTGIEIALGRSPDFAINHDAAALAMHEANHPETIHLTENIWKVNPQAVTRGKPVFLLHASPDCRHHSKAKGGKPVSRSVRGLADVVLVWAREVQPQIITLENVEEFQDWGPLGADDRPCPARRGQEFARWIRALEAMGYAVEWRELRACDYGAPTIRKRLFLVARRDGKPIIWPAPTHGDPKTDAVKTGALKPWRTAAEIIDWSLRCPSIFLTKSAARAEGLRIIRPLADKTMNRIARGVKRYVLERAEPFVVAYYGAGAGGQNRFSPINEPVRTLTTENRFGIVAPYLSYAQQGGANRPADAPMHTVCASTKDQNQVVVPCLAGVGGRMAQHNGNGVIGRVADAPVSTVTTGAAQQQPVLARLSLPFMAAYYGTGEGAACDDPLRTATTKDRFALADVAGIAPPFDEAKAETARQVAAFLRGEGVWDGRNADGTPAEFVMIGPFVIFDIGMRMLSPRELASAQGFPPDYILAVPFDGGTLTETDQRHKIGNSVCPPVAAALIRANCVDALGMPDVKRRRAAFPRRQPPTAPQTASLFEERAA